MANARRVPLFSPRMWLSLVIAPFCGLASLACATGAFAEAPNLLRNPTQIHAIIVGVDEYQHLPRLRGAVADGHDIEASLRQIGVLDIAALYNDKADRDSILKAVDDLSARVRPGDLVILSIAGHGAQEPEHVKGSESDGKDAVFLLAGFDSAAAGTRQRILDKEFNHLIKIFESRGARVLFVADTCSGGGLAREVDPRGAEMVYRSAPTYAISDDELKPVSTPSDAFSTELDFARSIFLAAVDKNSKAPEITIPGIEGYRGALSYAVARAVEGAADTNGDGKITVDELFAYVRQVTYQLSDQRQSIVSASPPSVDANREPVVELTRSVTVVEPPAAEPARFTQPSPRVAAPPPQAVVRVAVLDGANSQLAGIAPLNAKFEAVAPSQNPELIWDPHSGDVISGGDVVAREIGREDLPGVIDRVAAVRTIKQYSARAVQPLQLLPDNKVHHLGSQVQVAIDKLNNRSLLLFDIAGDGTVQLLYPQNESESQPMSTAQYTLPIKVRGPFGADQIVAITAPERMLDLERALGKMNARRTAGQLARLLSQNGEAGMRVGSVGVFTAQ